MIAKTANGSKSLIYANKTGNLSLRENFAVVCMKKSNMYEWVKKTKNFIGGECLHRCSYCYVRSFGYPSLKARYSGKLRLLEKEFQKPMMKGKVYFICDCNDLFADAVPKEWILRVLEYCKKYDNTYLFQTKNPKRFKEFIGDFPPTTILGTTIETNRDFKLSNAPNPFDRWYEMFNLGGFDIMISIEPIMDFDLDILVNMIRKINPKFVSIGADSKHHNLPEPSKEKIEGLIKELKKFTEVKLKDNLKRLMK